MEGKEMKYTEWKKYFGTLSEERRLELAKAFELLLTDDKIKESYHSDFLDLRYLLLDCLPIVKLYSQSK
jgi:hypothetical protein